MERSGLRGKAFRRWRGADLVVGDMARGTWILLGDQTRAKRVPGGRSVSRRCETCGEVTLWVECDVLDRIEVLSVSLLDTRSRRFVCLECGDDRDPADLGLSRVAPPRSAPPASPKPELARWSPRDTSRDVATISNDRVGPHHPEIDEEIAAIKRKLGKK